MQPKEFKYKQFKGKVMIVIEMKKGTVVVLFPE